MANDRFSLPCAAAEGRDALLVVAAREENQQLAERYRAAAKRLSEYVLSKAPKKFSNKVCKNSL